jgi:transposase
VKKNNHKPKGDRMKVMAGIDLHSNNAMCGIVDSAGKRLLHKKVPCELPRVLEVLAPYKERLDTVAVESTFNWYWLVDGLEDHGYNVALANPAAMEQYTGLKHTDDKSDAFFLGELLRLEILPTAHIYDRKLRPVRDVLRRRLLLVRHRTSLLLSLKSLHARTTGQPLSQARAKALEPGEAAKLFSHPAEQFMAREQAQHIGQLTKSIAATEKLVLSEAKKLPCYQRLQSLPGVGRILALTITLETGDIKRFPSAGDYASYCRTVDSQRLSNGKKKGENNAKCGNKYLAWAYVEAANFARRLDPGSRQFFDRKLSKTNRFVATKALACKWSKAAWYIMSQGVSFDPKKVFPGRAAEILRPGAGKPSPKTPPTKMKNNP